MQFKKVLIFMAVLCSAISCIEVDKSLGDALIPESEELYMSYSEIELPLRVNVCDSLQSIDSEIGIFGAFNTKEYGYSNFATVGDVSLSFEGVDLGEDHVITSVYLVLPVDEKYALNDQDLHIPQEVNVYRTLKHLDSLTSYNNSFTKDDYKATPLNKTPVTYFGGDSIKFYLDHSLGYELLDFTEEQADSMELYNKTHKGLIVKCENPYKTNYGGRMNIISLENSILYIKCNFQPTWDEGLERKDTLIGMYFTNSHALNLAEHESKGLVDLINEKVDIPIEGVAGLKPYIDGRTLKDSLTNWHNRVKRDGYNLTIGNATFYLPVDIPSDYDMHSYPQNIFPATREFSDEYNLYKYSFTEDIWITDNPNGELNRSLRHYSGDISYYIRDLFALDNEDDENIKKYDCWFIPITIGDDAYGTPTYEVDIKSYYKGHVKGNLNSTVKPRVKIMYVLNKSID